MQWLMCALLYLLLASSCYVKAQSNDRFGVIHEWSYVDFTYPSDAARSAAIQQSIYIPENIAVLDSAIYIDQRGNRRVFVSTPRFNDGIPATVSEVTNFSRENQSLLRPFPNWESQSVAQCEGPVSVYRTHIDSCGRLWILDTGRIDTFTNPRRACQPKILVYDLANNDNRLVRYEFPDGVVTSTSNLVTLITDIRPGSNSCQNTVAYIADVNAYGLVVYDYASRSSWRINHNYFYPFPTDGTIQIHGVTFDLMDGVFGISLGLLTNGDRNFYFHSLASLREGTVPASFLRNFTNLSRTLPAERVRKAFVLSEEVKPGPTSLEIVTNDGIMIFAVITKDALYCWNTRQPLKASNIHLLYQNAETLQFVSGMQLLGDLLVVTSSRLHEYIDGRKSTSGIRYRILAGSASALLANSACSGTRPSRHSG